MNDTQTLEMQIKTTGEQTLKVLQQMQTTLTSLSTTLGKTKTAASGLEDIGKAAGKGINNVNKLGNSLSKVFSLVVAKKAALKAMDFLDSAVNRAEELNLFNVVFKNIEKDGVKTFSTLGKEAMDFQVKLNNAFGTNMTETLRYQGLFQAMATNVGIDEKYASIMSENMTKLTYDLASLYNKSEKTTAEALRAGVYAGMTKPLRGYGLDVTEKSLKGVLGAIGINDRTISDMNQAEKEILRYISTLNQAKSAMGDFAQTIESPANQLKIFKQQLVEAKAAWGNLFMGMYAEILPYANAILMVLKEIAKAIASFFNLNTSDFNTGIGSLEETYEGLDNIGNGASKASKAAKELKRQILGFDQINNLTTPTTASSGSGSGTGGLTGGIDKRLLAALTGYDNLMDQVKMKANEIRDRWMQILGFQRVLNPLTGEYQWEYQGILTTIKNLWNEFKKLNPQVKAFITFLTFSKLISGVSNLIKALGGTGLGGILKDNISFFKKIKNVGVEAWAANASGAERFKTAAEGIGTAVVSWGLVKTGMEDIVQTGGSILSVFETIAGTAGTVFGGIQAGAAITKSTWGAVAGGLIGGLSSLVTIIQGIAYANDEFQQKLDSTTEDVKKKYEEWQNSVEALKKSYKIVDSETEYYQKLYDELTTIVDENGKIKKGYEDRAKVITGELAKAFGVEIEIVGDTIKEYDKLKDKVQEAIDKEKARLKLVALEDKAKEAIKNEKQAKEDLSKASQELTEAEERYENAKKLGGVTQAKALLQLQQAQDNYKTAKATLKGYTDTIRDWEKATEISVTNNTEELNWYFDHESELYGKSTNERYKYWSDYIQENKNNLEQLEKDRGNYSEKDYLAQKKQYEDNIDLAKREHESLRLVARTSAGNITDDMVEAWKNMANESTAEFMRNFDQLPEDMKTTLLDKMKGSGFTISDQLQKELDKSKVTVTVTTKYKIDWTNLNNATVNGAKALEKSINEILKKKANGGVYSSGSWKNIPQYANGGSPTHGTLFAAGENGAEIVGNINRRTEVLNRSQIASAIYTAVADAMRASNGGKVQVDLYAHTDEGVVIDRINQKTKQTGVCPITIPSY